MNEEELQRLAALYRSGAHSLEHTIQVAYLHGRRENNDVLTSIEVTQPNGKALPAPCAISGCHYDDLQRLLNALVCGTVKDALASIRGLQERVKFTKDFDAMKVRQSQAYFHRFTMNRCEEAKDGKPERYRIYGYTFYDDHELMVSICTIYLRDEAVKEVARLKATLGAYVAWHGGCHIDCPEDDTCACIGKPINDAVNAALTINDANGGPV